MPPAHEGVETTGVVNVTQGDSVTLPCNVRGNPPPQISWFKDNLPLPEAGRNFYVNTDGGLVIQQMSVAEEGQYRCVASNIAGNVSKDVRITILGGWSTNNFISAFCQSICSSINLSLYTIKHSILQ